MLSRITRHIYLNGLRSLERGDLDGLLRRFDPNCRLIFVGDTPLGADLSSRADVVRWFERFARLIPSPRFDVQQIVVAGAPWNQHLAAHVIIRSSVAGADYQNQFGHFLRLRWGRVVEDLVIEDTQTWERACRRLVAAGVTEAGEGPLGSVANVIASTGSAR